MVYARFLRFPIRLYHRVSAAINENCSYTEVSVSDLSHPTTHSLFYCVICITSPKITIAETVGWCPNLMYGLIRRRRKFRTWAFISRYHLTPIAYGPCYYNMRTCTYHTHKKQNKKPPAVPRNCRRVNCDLITINKRLYWRGIIKIMKKKKNHFNT